MTTVKTLVKLSGLKREARKSARKLKALRRHHPERRAMARLKVTGIKRGRVKGY